MLPSLNRFRQVGNAAGMGAKLALLSLSQRSQAHIASQARYIELAANVEELASTRTQDRKLKQRIIEALRQKLGLRSLQANKTARLI